jgi:hypothetical protein
MSELCSEVGSWEYDETVLKFVPHTYSYHQYLIYMSGQLHIPDALPLGEKILVFNGQDYNNLQ